MVRQFLRGICIIIISLVFDISQDTQNVQATQNFTPTPVDNDDLRVFPGDLVCNREGLPISDDEPTWMGITIGQSTLDDVKTLLTTFRYKYTFIDNDNYNIRFVIWDPFQVEQGEPTSIRLCLNKDIIQVMAVAYTFPLSIPRPNLSDLITQFGSPDAITWTDNPATRVVFWFEHGFAAVVTVIPNEVSDPRFEPTFGRVVEEIYFPYQDIEGYEDRWPYNQTRKFNVYLPSPEDPSVDFGPENPFDFDAIIATITAQPSRTPTPTWIYPSPTPTATIAP